MGEDPGYVEEVASPEVEYTVFVDDVHEIRGEETIGEFPVGGLSR
jgi:hypothetical protein